MKNQTQEVEKVAHGKKRQSMDLKPGKLDKLV